MRGADIVVETLARAGVRKVFTLSGNHVMPVFDAALGIGIDLVHVRHEAAAVHMADAWARTTGEVGVALVTGGAGHANAIGALCTAAASESPVLLLSGHAALDEIGLGAFQEMRQADLAEPVTKASWTARSAAGLADDIARAMRIARSGRPGPGACEPAVRRAGMPRRCARAVAGGCGFCAGADAPGATGCGTHPGRDFRRATRR